MTSFLRCSKLLPRVVLGLAFSVSVGILSCAPKGQMFELLREWRVADGEKVFVIEEKLFDRLLANPNEFYEAMTSDSASFNRFVSFLQSGVFTNYGSIPVAKLELRRTTAIKRLEASRIMANHTDLHSRVLKQLRELRAQDTD